jgi:hypothetical protein
MAKWEKSRACRVSMQLSLSMDPPVPIPDITRGHKDYMEKKIRAICEWKYVDTGNDDNARSYPHDSDKSPKVGSSRTHG